MGTSKALSLHIGLNRISKTHYGTDGQLFGCENDAAAMRRIAEARGFSPTTVLNEHATADAVLTAIRDAARGLAPGGIFLLTYAGHGSQIEDLDGDELKGEGGDGLDETWCLFDRMVADDELYRCWAEFPRGCRIAFVSDSCHSGTLARVFLARARALRDTGAKELPRALDPGFATIAVSEHFEVYRHLLKRGPAPQIDATVILISGCKDDQLSSDGSGGNGFFTSQLLDVWANGSFRGSYPSFHAAIDKRMPERQKPNYMVVGAANQAFQAQTPFTTDNTGDQKMDTTADLSPRVAKLLKRHNGEVVATGREISGGCNIGISFDRQLIQGLDDEALLRFFQNDVAPRMLDNWLTLNDVVTPVRGGEISCTASTGGGGSVSCTGTIRF